MTVLAGKGTDVVELNYKPRDLDFAWLAPGGVRNPSMFTATAPDSRATFRENYPGGWQEIVPSGGLPSSFDGAEYGLHGEVFNVPWDVTIVEDTNEEVAVRFTVRLRRSPFLLEKTIRLRSGVAGFRFDERLVNVSPVPAQAMWGHHITFGVPFLTPGSRIHLPDGITVTRHSDAVAPDGGRVPSPTAFPWPYDPANDVDLSVVPDRGAPSAVMYLSGFREGDSWYDVMRTDGQIGGRVAWDGAHMPYLWFWREFGGSSGYPWYGRNYNIGLEPFSSVPSHGLAAAVANDTALHFAPGEGRGFWLTFSILDQMN